MNLTIDASGTVGAIERLATDATNALTPLADKLGLAAKYVFGLFVRQNYVWGTVNLFWVIVMVIAAGILIRWASWTHHKEDFQWGDGRGDTTVAGIIVAGGYVIALLLTIVACQLIGSQVIPRFMNPQYYAIQDMVTTGKQLVHPSGSGE